MDGLKTAQAHQASVLQRLNYVGKLLGDSADQHALQALKAAPGKHAKSFAGFRAGACWFNVDKDHILGGVCERQNPPAPMSP